MWLLLFVVLLEGGRSQVSYTEYRTQAECERQATVMRADIKRNLGQRPEYVVACVRRVP